MGCSRRTGVLWTTCRVQQGVKGEAGPIWGAERRWGYGETAAGHSKGLGTRWDACVAQKRTRDGSGTCLGHTKGLGGSGEPHRAQQVSERVVRYMWGAARGWEHNVVIWGAATVQGDSGPFVGHHEGLRTQCDL